MNQTMNHTEPLTEFALNIMKVVGQVEDLRSELNHLRNENQQYQQRIEILKQAFQSVLTDPVTYQPG